jgi:RimJ/RimL family protein N-acetyltransferase
MVKYGQGWVLCVPDQLVGEAKSLCSERSFADITCEGDAQQELWFARGLKDEERATLRNVATYGPLTRLAESLNVSAWSHYLHWYCDSASWSGSSVTGHVCLIQADDPHIWEQWLNWPGPSWGLSSKESNSYEAYGYVLDGQLVSVAQVGLEVGLDPKSFAWDFGIYTLPTFRRRGFATEASKAATASIFKYGRVPWYFYNHYNLPSSRLPQKLGYFFYSEALVSHGQ